jgi:hypothetical protein
MDCRNDQLTRGVVTGLRVALRSSMAKEELSDMYSDRGRSAAVLSLWSANDIARESRFKSLITIFKAKVSVELLY